MKTDTIAYAKRNKVTQNNTEEELKEELQSLITEDENEDNIEQILETQTKLKDAENKKLYDILSKKKNFNLLEDERPTRTFLNLESSKGGYTSANQKPQLQPTHAR